MLLDFSVCLCCVGFFCLSLLFICVFYVICLFLFRRSGEIVHLKIALKRNKFVLGLHGKPHSSIPELIKHYTEHKVPIKGLESFMLLYPVKRN